MKTYKQIWRATRKELGLCLLCNQPAAAGVVHCYVHHRMERNRSRDRYRAAAGIPQTHLLANQGRPRKA